MSARPLVLFTDFGSTDFYAGIMRAVLAAGSPTSPVLDLHHDIPAYDIDAASFVLARAFAYLPQDAVVVAVVDPGVGTDRRGLIITIGERTIVGPDNGLTSDLLVSAPLFSIARFVAIEESMAQQVTGIQARGGTFHGRDIFAPVAAAIALGTTPARFGKKTDGIVMLRDVPGVSIDGGVIRARGRYLDRFGNVMSDIPLDLVERVFGAIEHVRVSVAGHDAGPLRRTYAEGESGELIAIVNSWGLVEVAMNGGRAIVYLGNVPASSIRFELRRE